MNVKCGEVIKKHWLLGDILQRHEWIYKNKERRRCKKCSRKEMYFGVISSPHGGYEDWREVEK